jgi:glutamate N-acetyltransferase/amino-acid N-acetyltransferase
MPELHLLSPRGFRAGSVHAGIKTKNRDVGILLCENSATAAAVFTKSKVVSPAVVIGREHIRAGKLRGVVVNSGNANACTGKEGRRNAIRMCQLAAKEIQCDPHEFLPSSTGIIGQQLPMQKIERGIHAASKNLGNSLEHAQHFITAIETTDTKQKYAATKIKIGREETIIAGVCKGSGMIGPRLGLHATMLAYLTTDVKISPPILRKLIAHSAEISFNAVTVDDHASTNDTACVLASGLGANISSSTEIKNFAKALDEVCQSLAYQIAADGEGATKVIRIEVVGARSESDAKKIARTIANSPLVKCAMNGNDPNWGRIISAAGYAGADFDAEKAVLKLQGIPVFRRGQPVAFNADLVSHSLHDPEVHVHLSCGLGKSRATCWTCDLSKDYVTINADYHT